MNLQQKENLSVELPNNFGRLDKCSETLQHTDEELQGSPKMVPTYLEPSKSLQKLNSCKEDFQNIMTHIPKVEPRLSSDELLSLADFQLLNLQMNPLPLELYLPDDIGPLHIPGTPERNTNGAASLISKVNSLCDSLEFKINTSGRFIAELFVELPLKEEYPDYYSVIQRPICINDIRRRQYENTQDMVEDFALMFNNARTYNTKTSMVYGDSLELQTEFGRELHKLFPVEEAKDLEQQLANSCRSVDAKKERQTRKSPPPLAQPGEEHKEVVEDDGRTRAHTPRFKHATWLKRKEDNFFVYGSGSETDVTSDAEERPGSKRKRKEAVSRKGKIVGGR